MWTYGGPLWNDPMTRLPIAKQAWTSGGWLQGAWKHRWLCGEAREGEAIFALVVHSSPKKSNDFRCLVRLDSEAAKHEQSPLQISICFHPLCVLNTSGWQKRPRMNAKFIINTSDAERGQEMGSANGYEAAKYEPECVSCLLANKHIISQKCTMVSSRLGWSPLQRVPGLL